MNRLKIWFKQKFCNHDFKQDTQMKMVWCPKCGEVHFIMEKLKYHRKNSSWIL